MSVYIIAEIGPNHNGSFFKAKNFINKLSKIGVNAVKFQISDPLRVYSNDAFKAKYQKINDGKRSIIEMSKANQLTKEEHLKLSKYCKKKGLDYLCSAFDIKNLKFLINKIKVKYVKIPSGEVYDLEVLKYLSTIKKKIFLSTGMVDLKKLEVILKLLNKNFKKKIVLMHCISNYPASIEDINMRYMLKLKKKFNYDIGYSDHSLSLNTCLSAVSLGAKVIEKHVTLNKKDIGPDHKISSTISEFKLIIKNIREIEKICGVENKFNSKKTNEIINVARKSIATNKFLKKNHKLKKNDIVFKRPGTGISPLELDKVLGKKLKKDLESNRVIKFKFLKKN
jgi:N,N'-diacetyllegionaminate synthase